MFKYLFLIALSFPVSAFQTKQEIIDYCNRVMLKDGGNVIVLMCIQQELIALEEIKRVSQ